MFTVISKNNNSIIRTVYNTRTAYQKEEFLIYADCQWMWVDADEYVPYYINAITIPVKNKKPIQKVDIAIFYASWETKMQYFEQLRFMLNESNIDSVFRPASFIFETEYATIQLLDASKNSYADSAFKVDIVYPFSPIIMRGSRYTADDCNFDSIIKIAGGHCK